MLNVATDGEVAILAGNAVNGKPCRGWNCAAAARRVGSEPFQDDLALRLAALQQGVGTLEVARVDGAEVLTQRGFQYPAVNQLCYAGEQLVLGDHVGGLVHRTGEHQLPVQREGFALHGHHVEGLGIVDQCQVTLWLQRFDQFGEAAVGVGQADDVADLADADALELFGNRAGVIDHVVSPQVLDPCLGLRARGAADHSHLRELACQLGEDRAYPTGCADNQQ